MREFRFKVGDKVKVDIDIYDAVSQDIDGCGNDSCEAEVTHDEVIEEMWNYMVNTSVFEIEGADLSMGRTGNIFEYYFLKEFPGLRFSVYELKLED
jgi:hypothetical protein